MILSNSEIKKLIDDNFTDKKTNNILKERLFDRVSWEALYIKYGGLRTRDNFISECVRSLAKLNIIIRKMGGERII